MRLIDADALIEKLKSNFDNGDVYTDKDQFIIDCIHLLDNAPTVRNEYMRGYEAAMREYKRSQGEWLEPYESKIAQECSICHRQMPAPKWFYFCPNCGAEMRKG